MNVLTVWETRNVFGSEYVNALRGALFAEQRKQLEQCIQVKLFYVFHVRYNCCAAEIRPKSEYF